MKIAVIGCGGIGSFLAGHINKLIEAHQLADEFTFFDDDIVETKNILYQNFESGDVDDNKTEALSFKYPMISHFKNKRIETVQELKDFALIVLCADNNKIRRLTYDAVTKSYGTSAFIDVRSNGKTCGVFSSETENYLSTISDDDSSHSCQYPYQLAKKEIEMGNVIVASIGAAAILQFSRTGALPNDFIHSF